MCDIDKNCRRVLIYVDNCISIYMLKMDINFQKYLAIKLRHKNNKESLTEN